MRATLTALLFTSALASEAFAGQVLVVGSAPGQIHSMQDAVILAGDGDVILVKSGAYSSIRITDKSVAVVADTGAAVTISGAVRVSSLASTRSVVLSGLNVTGTVSSTLPELGAGLRAISCAGPITAQDCTFTGGSTVGATCNTVAASHGVELQVCAAVALARCTMTGGHGNNGFNQIPNEHPVQQGFGVWAAYGSQLSIDSGSVHGGSGGTTCNSYQDGTSGGEGIALTNSSLYACGTTSGGGAGTTPGGMVPGAIVGNGGNGLYGPAGTVNPIVSLANSFVAGPAGPSYFFCGICTSCCDGFNGAPTAGSLALQTLSGPAKRLSAPNLVRDNQTVTFRVDAAAGERVELAVTRTLTYQTDAASGCIQHVRDPNWIAIGHVPASGTFLTRTYSVPDLALAQPGTVLYAQARVTSTTGVKRLTNLQAVVLVDATY